MEVFDQRPYAVEFKELFFTKEQNVGRNNIKQLEMVGQSLGFDLRQSKGWLLLLDKSVGILWRTELAGVRKI